MSEKLLRFTKLLKEMFELEKSDLDFGIYRIMNIRKNEINNFIENTLGSEVNSILSKHATDNRQVKKRMEEIVKQSPLPARLTPYCQNMLLITVKAKSVWKRLKSSVKALASRLRIAC